LELLFSGHDVSSIAVKLQIEILISLRIVSREQYGISELTSKDSLEKLLKFTGLSGDVKLALSQMMNDNSGLALQGEVIKIMSICITSLVDHLSAMYVHCMYVHCKYIHICIL